jgi:hypothetical protein
MNEMAKETNARNGAPHFHLLAGTLHPSSCTVRNLPSAPLAQIMDRQPPQKVAASPEWLNI